MINQLNSSGAVPNASPSQYAGGLAPYTGNGYMGGGSPTGQVLGGAMGAFSQAMQNPEFAKMLAKRLNSFGGSTADPNSLDLSALQNMDTTQATSMGTPMDLAGTEFI